MPGPTTKLAFRRRALLAASWLAARADILQRELEAQGVTRRSKDILNRLDGPETVTMKSADLMDLIEGMKQQSAEIGRFSDWKG
jgi:hypothetical protein